jgi:hypothetical protein
MKRVPGTGQAPKYQAPNFHALNGYSVFNSFTARLLDFHVRIWLMQARHLIQFAVASIGSAFSSRAGGLFYPDGSGLRCNPVLGQFLLQTRLSYLVPAMVSRLPHLIKEIPMAIVMEDELGYLLSVSGLGGSRHTKGRLGAVRAAEQQCGMGNA